jgi:5-methylcytosine-specific restriction endonuclease McrA
MAYGRIPEGLRAEVAKRARYLCEYCRIPEAYSAIPRHSVDHIVPRRDAGKTELDNLALCCQGCNGAKSSKTAGHDRRAGVRMRVFHPRSDRWSDHFAWSTDFLRIEGLTDIGQTTVETLRMNRQGLINMRRSLIRDGVHPPSEAD